MINALIVDDHSMVRAAIRQILSQDSSINIVAETGTGNGAIEIANSNHLDIVLLDINLPDINGLEVIKSLKAAHPDLKILIISGYTEIVTASKLIKEGAEGYISKEDDPKQILAGVLALTNGQVYFSPTVTNKLINESKQPNFESPFDGLSEREKEVVDMILAGIKPIDIAKKLKLSPKTVNTFRYRLFVKLNISNDVELALLAIRHQYRQSSSTQVE